MTGGLQLDPRRWARGMFAGVALLVLGLLIAACTPGDAARQGRSALTIFAAASLTDVRPGAAGALVALGSRCAVGHRPRRLQRAGRPDRRGRTGGRLPLGRHEAAARAGRGRPHGSCAGALRAEPHDGRGPARREPRGDHGRPRCTRRPSRRSRARGARDRLCRCGHRAARSHDDGPAGVPGTRRGQHRLARGQRAGRAGQGRAGGGRCRGGLPHGRSLVRPRARDPLPAGGRCRRHLRRGAHQRSPRSGRIPRVAARPGRRRGAGGLRLRARGRREHSQERSGAPSSVAAPPTHSHRGHRRAGAAVPGAAGSGAAVADASAQAP